MENKYVIRIDQHASGRLVTRGYLAGGATWDGTWITHQDRHPEEIRQSYKTIRGAEKRANELRANGVQCTVEVNYPGRYQEPTDRKQPSMRSFSKLLRF